MNDNDRVSFTAKELLVEVRADVKAVRNEVTALSLEHTRVASESRQNTIAVVDHSSRLDAVERVWDRVNGGLKVAAGSFGLFSALVVALFTYLLATPK